MQYLNHIKNLIKIGYESTKDLLNIDRIRVNFKQLFKLIILLEDIS